MAAAIVMKRNALPKLALSVGLFLCGIATATVSQGTAVDSADVLLGDDGLPISFDAEGLPERRLSDAELYRLLLHLSRTMEAATARLVRCHISGTPYETAGWRRCIEQP